MFFSSLVRSFARSLVRPLLCSLVSIRSLSSHLLSFSLYTKMVGYTQFNNVSGAPKTSSWFEREAAFVGNALAVFLYLSILTGYNISHSGLLGSKPGGKLRERGSQRVSDRATVGCATSSFLCCFYASTPTLMLILQRPLIPDASNANGKKICMAKKRRCCRSWTLQGQPTSMSISTCTLPTSLSPLLSLSLSLSWSLSLTVSRPIVCNAQHWFWPIFHKATSALA